MRILLIWSLFLLWQLILGGHWSKDLMNTRQGHWATPPVLNEFFTDFLFFGWFFRDRVSLYSPGCPGTHFVDQAGLKLRNLPASASRVLGLKTCATTPGMFFLKRLIDGLMCTHTHTHTHTHPYPYLNYHPTCIRKHTNTHMQNRLEDATPFICWHM
jgi:hypothetical protein